MNYSDVFVVILVCHECAVPEGRGGEGDREGGGEKGKKTIRLFFVIFFPPRIRGVKSIWSVCPCFETKQKEKNINNNNNNKKERANTY